MRQRTAVSRHAVLRSSALNVGERSSAPEDALGGALASLVEAPGRYKPPSLPTWSRFTRTEDERRKEMPAQTHREDGDFVRAPCAERSYPVVTQRQDQAKRVTVRNVSGGPKTAKNGI
jgi:hypothetical protein